MLYVIAFSLQIYLNILNRKFRVKMKPFARLKSGQENERFYDNFFSM